ncbi:hypothetical protein CDL60_03755 [Roseateles noduli]|nr:hypothetical protein CDL60_03755 [Roseateles noduli]
MERGLIDANLGSGLVKKRIGRSGAGKREGYRVMVARRGDGPWFFIEGYAKNERENVDIDSLDLIRRHAKALTAMSVPERAAAVERGTLNEVMCDA